MGESSNHLEDGTYSMVIPSHKEVLSMWLKLLLLSVQFSLVAQ